MKKTLLCMALSALAAVSAQAQNRDGTVSLDQQFVIYKWYEGGIAHYGKAPPRGVSKYIMLNEHGMEITKERPFANETGSNIIRPVRPAGQSDSPAALYPEQAAAEQPLPEGSVSREQRCNLARENIEMMRNKTTVYEDDGRGNLVPLSADGIAQRMQEAEAQVSEFCQ